MKNQSLHKQAHDLAFGILAAPEHRVRMIAEGTLNVQPTMIPHLQNDMAMDNQAVLPTRPFKRKRVVDHPRDFLL
jgi:hypothetical protein